MAGLPGTGLGGIFYILLIFWIIVRKALNARTYGQWRRIAPLGGMAATIILLLSGETWLIAKFIGKVPSFGEIVGSATTVSSGFAVVLALTPIFTLAALISALHMARLLLPREGAGVPARLPPAAR